MAAPCVAPSKITIHIRPLAPLREIVSWAAGFTCKPIVYPAALDRVAPRIVVQGTADLTPVQAMAAFTAAMRAAGILVTVKPSAITLALDPSAPVIEAPPSDELDVDTMIEAIVLTDPTNARISRALANAVIADPDILAQGVRVIANIRGGTTSGYKIYAVRSDSFLARIGLTNGDTVMSINAYSLDATAKVSELQSLLAKATVFQLDIVRRGKPLMIEIVVE